MPARPRSAHQAAPSLEEARSTPSVDEMEISLVPVFLGEGERLFDGLGVGRPQLAHVRTVAAPGVMHLKFERA
jgi:hypothetical protein